MLTRPDRRTLPGQEVNYLKTLIDPSRFLHCLRVEKLARQIIEFYGLTYLRQKVFLATLFHDATRGLSEKRLIKEAKKYGLKVAGGYWQYPELLHAKVSAFWLKDKFGINDWQVFQAVWTHTTGSAKMGLLSLIVYLADHHEPAKKYNNSKLIRPIIFRNLNLAAGLTAQTVLNYLLKTSCPVHPDTLRCRDWYFLKFLKNDQT